MKIFISRWWNGKCINAFNYELDESDIEYYIEHRELENIPDKVLELIDRQLTDYADDILRKLKEHSINVETTPIIFVGGGAKVVRDYGTRKLKNIEYNLDVKANAKGYALLAREAVKRGRR